MERMAEVVPEADAQALQHFLSQSDWDWEPVITQVAQEVDVVLGGHADTCLLIDETGIPKKGKKSVGVARQWCGQLGKTDSCQVGVFAALAQESRVSLVDARLYLPKEWVNSPGRCDRAGVPDADQIMISKAELGLEMVRKARARGLRFEWVAADGGYGKDPSFLRSLDDLGAQFVIDVHRDQRVFLSDPEPTPSKGPRSKRLVTAVKKQTLQSWVQAQPETAWKRVFIRHSTRGALEIEILHEWVWLWNGREAEARHWRAIISREVGRPETLKYALSNAPESISVQTLAHRQRQRYWVERAFQDAKVDVGLGEYQARNWKAWHHHMALVMMAMLFILRQREESQEQLPLLSSTDIKLMLVHFLPRRDASLDEVIRQMKVRHRQRQDSIDSAYRRQKSQAESGSGTNLTK